jgi:hypothetical protein
MTGSGWTPNEPSQYDPGQYNPGAWAPSPASGPANAGPWSAGPPQSPPAMPAPQPAGYPPVGGYGQPGSYPQRDVYSGAPNPTRAPSTTGIAVATVGAALAVLGLFLDWYASGSTTVGVKALVRASKLDGAPGLAHLYFGWALWFVLAIAIAVAISANLAGSAVVPLAVGGAVAGAASTVLTFAALNSGRASGSPFDHAAVGLWLFLLGPLILAAGALFALARPTR